MPLPEVAENNTPRLFIEYTAAGKEHTLLLRPPRNTTSAGAIEIYNDFAPVLAAALPNNDAVQGARYSEQDSNISLPLTVTPATGTLDAWADNDARPRFFSCTGRGSDGRDVKATVFTPYAVSDLNGYRLQIPIGFYLAFRNALVAQGVNLRTVSDTPITWNSYINLGINAYYQRKNRRGG